MRKLIVALLTVLCCLIASCADSNDKSSGMKPLTSTVELDWTSAYAGIDGMNSFYACSGIAVAKNDKRRLGHFPRSLNDFLSFRWRDGLPGGISLLDEPKLLRDANIDEYARFASILGTEVLRDDYLRYDAKQDPASVYLAPREWLENIVLFGDVGNGRIMLLANPNVSTKDGEWEVWMHDWSFGTYRFSSAAELLTHLYLFNVTKISDVEYRFGREFAPGTCASHLFAFGMDRPPERVPDK